MQLRLISTLLIGVLLLMVTGCQRGWNEELPPADELGSPRGFEVARAIVHLHSPFSHDACDGDGLPGGEVDEECLADLRRAICLNRVDFAMLTDHPSNMAASEMHELLLPRGGDQLVQGAFGPVANRMSCPNGHAPLLTVGFEDNLMPVGMTRHLDPDPGVRDGLYNGDGAGLVSALRTSADAVVFQAHTEGRALDELRSLGVDGVELFSLHAILDPTIRLPDLGLPALEGIFGLLPFLFSPAEAPVPDLALLAFVELSPVYFEKWNRLTAEGQHLTGIVGTDSHQNVFPLPLGDGERGDSHRRTLRWASNHLLVNGDAIDDIKDALASQRGWIVFEAIGSPVGVDFFAQAGGTVVGVGETGGFVPGSTTIHVPLPTLHPDSPQGGPAPRIAMRLRRVLSNGSDEVVAEAVNAPIAFAALKGGTYWVEISIVPSHLLPFLGSDPERYLDEVPWILINHLRLT